MPKWSIVFPAYNEADKIEASLKKTIEFFNQKDFDYEIVVVEDGSTDQTLEILKNLASRYPQISLYPNEKNLGKGESVKRGMLKAKGELILFSDVDLATPLQEFDKFPEWFEKGFDVVIASRRLTNSNVERKQPFKRRFFGNCFYFLVHTFLLPDVHDTNCGFKAYRRKVAQDIFPRLTVSRWGFDTELLVIAQKRGYKIREVPVSWYDADTSTVKVRRVVFETMGELVRIKWNLWQGAYD